MRWTSLGHAMWLAEAGEVTILFDPLLLPTHHGDVFELWPPRALDESALRPDFVVITHRHPDHFDVPSLARLARRDPDAVVLTSDELVARTARRLGFRTVARIEPFHRVELAGVTLTTTPSQGACLEWGVVIENADGMVFNQVDTVLGGAGEVRAMLAEIGAGPPDLALVRWQPALEVSAALSGSIGFPFHEYAKIFDELAALEARAFAPTAAGVRHTAGYGWLNHSVYPLGEARFRRDLQARCPTARVLAAPPGTVFEIEGGVVDICRSSPLVEAKPVEAAPFVPFVIEPLRDPNPGDHDLGRLRRRVDAFVDDDLAPALKHAIEAPRTLVLEVVFPDGPAFFTFRTGAGRSGAVERSFEADYDVIDAIAASYLVDVLDGRRHWGEPLLGGLLRACVRGYQIDEGGLRRFDLAPIFLYYALSYEASQERWVEHQLAALEREAR